MTRFVALRTVAFLTCCTVMGLMSTACGATGSTVELPHGGTYTGPSSPRPSNCPPGALPLSNQPHSREDADIDGNGTIDLFLGKYHWNGGYYDLTVEVWCMDGRYLKSLR